MGLDSLPELSKPKDFINYMYALQIQAYGQITDVPYQALYKNIKALIKQYGAKAVVRGIFDATHGSDFPFSTKHIEQQITWRQEHYPAINYKILGK